MSQRFKGLFWPESLNSLSCSLNLKNKNRSTNLCNLTGIFNTDKCVVTEEYSNIIGCNTSFTLCNHGNFKVVCTFNWMAEEQRGKIVSQCRLPFDCRIHVMAVFLSIERQVRMMPK